VAERRVKLSSLTERVIDKVQKHLSQATWPNKKIPVGEAINWIIEDVKWCKPDVPAYGRWSPVLLGILEDALAEEKASRDDQSNC
jgi:hypothetical protein